MIFAVLYLPNPAVAQEFGGKPDGKTPGETDYRKVVIPISSAKVLPYAHLGFTGNIKKGVAVHGELGTGFCLDSGCRFIVTNYHVAVGIPAPRIKGQKVKQRYLATGPEDKEATLNFQSDGDVKGFAVGRDLALFELRNPLRGYHGIKFSMDDLEPGEEVDLYGYPRGSVNPLRSLVHATAKFKAPTTSGLLAFEYDGSSRESAGASGGIVVQRKTGRIVGVITRETDQLALAVPTQALLDFVSRVQPFVALKTFPAFKNVSPMSVDLYPEFEPQPDFNEKFEPTHAGVLEHRPVEPRDVVEMRKQAQQLADGMRDFIAVQSYAWGSGDKDARDYAEYEVRVIDGKQSFREYPNGKKELGGARFPRTGDFAFGSDEWAELPKMLGNEHKLRARRAKDTEFEGRKIKVFQYRATVEDNLCPFEPIDDYIFLKIDKVVAVGCYGEAWVDQDGKVVRISENLDLSDKRKEFRGWTQFRTVVTYGPVKIADEPERQVPLTIFTEGENARKLYWCRGAFSNYRLFTAHSRLVAAAAESKSAEK